MIDEDETLPLLTSRQRQVLSWVRDGKTYAEIGAIMGLSPKTVEYHMISSMNKLGTCDKLQSVVKALNLGIIPFSGRGIPASPVAPSKRHHIDINIGSKITSARVCRDLDSVAVAKALAIAPEEFELIESGNLRASAAQIIMLSQTLAVPIGYFFGGLTR